MYRLRQVSAKVCSFFQIHNDFLDVLTYLMELRTCRTTQRCSRLLGFWKTASMDCIAACTEQIYTQTSPAFEAIQHIQPELAVFVLSDPDSWMPFMPSMVTFRTA